MPVRESDAKAGASDEYLAVKFGATCRVWDWIVICHYLQEVQGEVEQVEDFVEKFGGLKQIKEGSSIIILDAYILFLPEYVVPEPENQNPNPEPYA